MKLETTIPFSGFYESIHSHELDYALENLFENDTGDINQQLFELAYNKINWSDVHKDYAKAYTEALATECNLESLKFTDLVSPKYYNFTTDRIFCSIDLSEVEKIYNAIPKEELESKIKDRFTSYDGFISYYSNDLEDWETDLSKWDHNQIGTLLECYIDLHFGDSLTSIQESELLDPVNELSYHLLHKHNEGLNRLVDLNDYLNKRNERSSAQ